MSPCPEQAVRVPIWQHYRQIGKVEIHMQFNIYILNLEQLPELLTDEEPPDRNSGSDSTGTWKAVLVLLCPQEDPEIEEHSTQEYSTALKETCLHSNLNPKLHLNMFHSKI